MEVEFLTKITSSLQTLRQTTGLPNFVVQLQLTKVLTAQRERNWEVSLSFSKTSLLNLQLFQ